MITSTESLPEVTVEEYPCLKIGKTTGSVYLFSTAITGMQLTGYCVGEFHTERKKENYSVYTGSITLTNE